MVFKLFNFSYRVSILFCFITTITNAQNFTTIEAVSGLGDLKNNNGVAVVDFDGDLDLDIFVVAKAQDDASDESTKSKLYRNNNDGSFTDVTVLSGLTNLFPIDQNLKNDGALAGFKRGVFFGDYDNDGFPDVLFTHFNKIQLFHNNGNGTFTDVTVAAGFKLQNDRSNTGAIWFDYNNDSFLDIYICAWKRKSQNYDQSGIEEDGLFLNNGNGTFQKSAIRPNIINDTIFPGYSPFPFDVNNDGWMDLYISNDFKTRNTLNINQSGIGFIEDANSYGLENKMNDMGLTIGDFNLDGNFDFFITSINENALLQNDGANNFTETALANNLPGYGFGWGAKFADFDLDGDEDLIVVNGFGLTNSSNPNHGPDSNKYYKNFMIEGQTGFQDATDILSLNEPSVSVSALDYDYDNDGDLDLYITNSDQKSIFYENRTLNFYESNTQHFFKIILEGTVSNRDAIGTTVTLTTPTRTYKRYYTGAGFLSQSLKPVHFGLGLETQITDLEIKWPSGLIETFQNLNADETIKAIEGQGISILNILPSQKIIGCTDPLSCSYNPNATHDDGISCTYLPSNTITGETNSGYFKTELYSYPLAMGSVLTWKVSGGEIVYGQGTGEVAVKWNISQNASIEATENNGVCSSLGTNLNINLHVDELPNNKSIARLWNEILLEAIRGDFARPTIHSRNLFHSSVIMYDSWAIYDSVARPYFIGNTLNNFHSELKEFTPKEDKEESRRKTISYAMYRLLSYRFEGSPDSIKSQNLFDLIMDQLGYDTDFTSISYESGDAAALGNYIAQNMIDYGHQDGSRELTGFDNAYYKPINKPLVPTIPTNEFMTDPNRWQSLNLDTYIDQSGNLIEGTTIDFLSPEWGNVYSFAMDDDDKISYQRDGNTYNVFNDPGKPPFLNLTNKDASSDAYIDGFSMVSVWSSHLDHTDGVTWDISPGAIGNTHINEFPRSYDDYPSFYNMTEGGDIGKGHSVNPVTGLPYTPQLVPRGDYTRVLAEFWADGPHSETPPGHWFTIFNYVSDHPLVEKKFEGKGEVLSDLEWDVKSYFILGGTMHDAAVSSWGIKGWYDYTRPVSAIRNMALIGQSTDATLDNYNVAGIKLKPGYIEVVKENDPLVGTNDEHLGKIKLYTWKGPEYISDPETDFAGVGWILAENWWPYQRPTFVTPPFAGFVSGHSTFSRAASEVMTLITGSPFFPGGLGEFKANKNEFLVFEEGPSVDVVLQWATYRDASDQTSLSRIWGGIHPPADDIPGRLIGEKIGLDAFGYAIPYFSGENKDSIPVISDEFSLFPNPTINKEIFVSNTRVSDQFSAYDLIGRQINISSIEFNKLDNTTLLKFPSTLSQGLIIVKVNMTSKLIVIKN